MLQFLLKFSPSLSMPRLQCAQLLHDVGVSNAGLRKAQEKMKRIEKALKKL